MRTPLVPLPGGGVAMDPAGTLALSGFSGAQQSIYLFLLDTGHADIDVIAAHTGLAEREVHRDLRDLRERGFVAHHGGTPERFAAVDPRSFLSTAADALVQDAHRIRASIAPLLDRFERAQARADGVSSAQLSLSDDAAVVAGWYAQLQHHAVREVRVFDRPPYLSLPMPDLEARSISKGVTHRALYSLDSFDRPGAWDDLRHAQTAGETSRIVPSLPMKMVMADAETAIVCLSLHPGENDSVLTTSAPLIAVLIEVFDTYWNHGVPVDADHGADKRSRLLPDRAIAEPGMQERAIVSLIAAGATDERIAEHLGISVRSVRRRTSALMRDLGAENRFQFGMLAARAGWI